MHVSSIDLKINCFSRILIFKAGDHVEKRNEFNGKHATFSARRCVRITEKWKLKLCHKNSIHGIYISYNICITPETSGAS